MLLEAPSAPYPEAALAAEREGSVLLEMEISAEGEVVRADVVTPAGFGFDEAALAAVRNFRFSPALDEAGAPAPSIIQYRYDFSLELVPVLAVQGTVLEAGTRQPLPGARARLVDDSGRVLEAIADAEGVYRFADIAPGQYALSVAAPGFGEEVTAFAVVEGEVAEATFYLAPDRGWERVQADDEMVVEGERVEPEVVERRLQSSEIRAMPGTGGDIVRAVQSLPGVARSPFNTGQLIVRGTSPEDSGFYLGGAPLPIVFHFGGLATVINADSLDQVAYLPGNFGVRYGRRVGGVVDLRTDRSLPDRSWGYASVDLFQTSLFVQSRITEQAALTFSGRRSYIDAILNPFVQVALAEGDTLRLPAFTDAQLRLLRRKEDGSTLDGMLILSQDRFSYSEQDFDAEDGTETSELTIQFLKGWVQWREILEGGWITELTLSGGPEDTRAVYQEEDETFDQRSAAAGRLEVYRGVPEDGWVGWRMGVDVEVADQEYSFDAEALNEFTEFDGVESGQGQIVWPGVYIEQTQRTRDGSFEGVPGVRVDAMITDSGYQAVSIDPRLGLRWTLSPSTRLRGSVGRYSQFPLLRELEPPQGNDSLLPEWALQTSLGIDQEINTSLSVEATAYHLWLQDVIVGREDRFVFQLGPPPTAPLDTAPYANEGTGRNFGVEGLVRYEDPRLLAWLGATVSSATRVKRPDQERSRFEYDQPLVLTAVSSYKFPRALQLGVRLRYSSGNPYTPVTGNIRVLDGEHTFLPLYDTNNSSRTPTYFTIDTRVDKTWTYEKWRLTAYLDLQNTTNRRNVELVNYSYDWSEELYVYSLPILPAFGVRGEW